MVTLLLVLLLPEGEGEEEPEVEGALPASGLRRRGSPEATVTAEAAARRVWDLEKREKGEREEEERALEREEEGKARLRLKEQRQRQTHAEAMKRGKKSIQKRCSLQRNRAALVLNSHRGIPGDEDGRSECGEEIGDELLTCRRGTDAEGEPVEREIDDVEREKKEKVSAFSTAFCVLFRKREGRDDVNRTSEKVEARLFLVPGEARASSEISLISLA